MRRKWIGLLLTAFSLTACIGMDVRADDLKGKEGWQIEFTGENKMENNFSWSDGYVDGVSELQPGDNIVFTLTLKNTNGTTTDWYMTNEVMESLEDTENESASGGAYTYYLTYTNGNGVVTELYNSDMVGGESGTGRAASDTEGLKSATQALKDYFYLDTLAYGQSGLVTLTIALDGETQGNSYQNTLANLKMNFAVELVETPTYVDETVITTAEPVQRYTTVVKTSDDTNLVPVYIAMAVSGVVLLILAVFSLKAGKKEKGRAA